MVAVAGRVSSATAVMCRRPTGAVCSELQEAAERTGHGLISNGALVRVERDWFEQGRLHRTAQARANARL